MLSADVGLLDSVRTQKYKLYRQTLFHQTTWPLTMTVYQNERLPLTSSGSLAGWIPDLTIQFTSDQKST